VIPLAASQAAGGVFATAPLDDSTLAPWTDAAAAWLHLTSTETCTSTAPPSCTAERYQVWDGTVTVASVRPLRLQIAATVSYPADSGLPPVRLEGPIVFGVQRGSYCPD